MAVKPANISGLLNINKPQGITSHDVVARIRKLSRQRKVGHTGTLDPMATGVLLLCLGQATRLIEYIDNNPKQYRGIIRFGTVTDSLDADGQVVAVNETAHLTETMLHEALTVFQGEIDQTPPLFSAVKKQGRPLYKFARAGQTVDVPSRKVTIYSLTWIAWQPPDLTLDIICSPGTYIRSLARDLGNAVGTGAHLTELTRTGNGKWSLAEAVTLETLEKDVTNDTSAWQQYLQPLDQAIMHLPQITLSEQATTDVRHGRPVDFACADEIYLVRAYTSDGEFAAILTRSQSDDRLWQPKKVFHAGG